MDQATLLDRPFTVAEARAAGLDTDALQTMFRRGAIKPAVHGVYVGSGVQLDLATRAAAVARVLPDGAALCRRLAAFLHGVDLRLPGEQALPVEILVPAGATPTRRPGHVAYASTLPSEDITVVCGVPTTTARRTALDLARYLPLREAVVSVDALAHAGLVTIEELHAALPALRGRRGVRQLTLVIELADPRAESPMETRLRLVIVLGGLPRPEVQYELRDQSGILVARLDLAYPERRIGVEYDGWEFHRDRSVFDYDRDRQNAVLQVEGWQLRRYVARHVLHAPLVIVRQVGGLLAVTVGG